MNRTSFGLLVALIVIAASFAASAACRPPSVALKLGMKVIAALAGPNWAVAKVDAIKGPQVTVKYTDGGLGSLGKGEVVAHPSVLYSGGNAPCFKAGDKVIAQAQGATWRTATVLSVADESAEVKFMDGKKKSFKIKEIVVQPK